MESCASPPARRAVTGLWTPSPRRVANASRAGYEYSVFMIRAPLPCIAILLMLSVFSPLSRIRAQVAIPSSAVTFSPSAAEAGSPELIRVAVPKAQEVTGEWLGKKISFFQGRDGQNWFALVGLDVEAPVGPSTLRIEAKYAGSQRNMELPIEIHPAKYRTESISVAPRFVEPNPEDLKQIHADNQLKNNVFAVSAPNPLWHGDFRAPVVASATDSFGVRRMYNGKLASINKGMDFRAHTGTPVHAGNSGIVVLAQRLYYEGNCVVIDHGDWSEGGLEWCYGARDWAASALGGALGRRLSRPRKSAEAESEWRALAGDGFSFYLG